MKSKKKDAKKTSRRMRSISFSQSQTGATASPGAATHAETHRDASAHFREPREAHRPHSEEHSSAERSASFAALPLRNSTNRSRRSTTPCWAPRSKARRSPWRTSSHHCLPRTPRFSCTIWTRSCKFRRWTRT